MDLKQLNTFLTISKFQSFTKAAESLNYAQSSVTTQIRLLEEELGVRLFDRIGKTTTLTPEGKRLLPYAKQMLKLSSEIKDTICDDPIPKGTLTIGAAESLCVLRLPGILKEYRKRYPNVDVSLKFGSCADFRHFLCDNVIDAAFSLGVKIDGSEFVSVIEKEEPMLLLGYPCHPLTQKKEVLPFDLKGEPLILTEIGCSYRAAFERILNDAGIVPVVSLESGSVQAIKQFTMSGLGLCLLPEAAVTEEIASSKLIPINWCGPKLHIISQILYHKNKWLSPALKAFLELSQEMLS